MLTPGQPIIHFTAHYMPLVPMLPVVHHDVDEKEQTRSWSNTGTWLPDLLEVAVVSHGLTAFPPELHRMVADYSAAAWTRAVAEKRLIIAHKHNRQHESLPPTSWINDGFELLEVPARNERLIDALYGKSYWLALHGLSKDDALWVIHSVIPERELVSPGALFYVRCVWLENVGLKDEDIMKILDVIESGGIPRIMWLGLSGNDISNPSTLHRIAQLRLTDRLTSLEWIEMSNTPLQHEMETDSDHPSWRDFKVLSVLGVSLRF